MALSGSISKVNLMPKLPDETKPKVKRGFQISWLVLYSTTSLVVLVIIAALVPSGAEWRGYYRMIDSLSIPFPAITVCPDKLPTHLTYRRVINRSNRDKTAKLLKTSLGAARALSMKGAANIGKHQNLFRTWMDEISEPFNLTMKESKFRNIFDQWFYEIGRHLYDDCSKNGAFCRFYNKIITILKDLEVSQQYLKWKEANANAYKSRKLNIRYYFRELVDDFLLQLPIDIEDAVERIDRLLEFLSTTEKSGSLANRMLGEDKGAYGFMFGKIQLLLDDVYKTTKAMLTNTVCRGTYAKIVSIYHYINEHGFYGTSDLIGVLDLMAETPSSTNIIIDGIECEDKIHVRKERIQQILAEFDEFNKTLKFLNQDDGISKNLYFKRFEVMARNCKRTDDDNGDYFPFYCTCKCEDIFKLEILKVYLVVGAKLPTMDDLEDLGMTLLWLNERLESLPLNLQEEIRREIKSIELEVAPFLASKLSQDMPLFMRLLFNGPYRDANADQLENLKLDKFKMIQLQSMTDLLEDEEISADANNYARKYGSIIPYCQLEHYRESGDGVEVDSLEAEGVASLECKLFSQRPSHRICYTFNLKSEQLNDAYTFSEEPDTRSKKRLTMILNRFYAAQSDFEENPGFWIFAHSQADRLVNPFLHSRLHVQGGEARRFNLKFEGRGVQTLADNPFLGDNYCRQPIGNSIDLMVDADGDSHSDCHLKCVLSRAEQLCGCRLWYMISTDESEACNATATYCFHASLNRLANDSNCDCVPSCSYAYYDLTKAKEGKLDARRSSIINEIINQQVELFKDDFLAFHYDQYSEQEIRKNIERSILLVEIEVDSSNLYVPYLLHDLTGYAENVISKIGAIFSVTSGFSIFHLILPFSYALKLFSKKMDKQEKQSEQDSKVIVVQEQFDEQQSVEVVINKKYTCHKRAEKLIFMYRSLRENADFENSDQDSDTDSDY